MKCAARFSAGSCLLWAAACTPAEQSEAPAPLAPHREEILATVDVFFLALASSDADAIAALHSPGAVNVIAEPEKGAAVRYRPVSEMVERMRSGEFPTFRERYWDPIVLERGGLAVVWTSYSIDLGDDRLHCGVDVFNMSKHDGTWKIDGLNFTMEPSACNEITPGARSTVRPDFSTLEVKEN